MMKGSHSPRIGKIDCHAKEPTAVSAQQLYAWIIWQFPKEGNQSTACGAVCPPTENLMWIPAKINLKRDEVLLYAHLDTYYETPEAAHSYFKQDKN